MKSHDHDHAHGDQHSHAHEAHQHHEPAATSTAVSPQHHHHELDSRVNPPPLRHDGIFGCSLLMTSSWNRVLGALVLIALLWSAVAWAVLSID